jgi:maleamate amidohydrolase
MTRNDDSGFDAAAEIYERAEINGQLGFGRRLALVVVDFTYGFTDPKSPLGSNMTPAVTAAASLIHDCRGARVPIFFTIHGYRSDLADLGVWADKYPGLRHLTVGSRWTQLDERLGVHDDDVVIVKQYPSAFFGSILNTHLNARGVDSIVIAGATTSGCVRATAVDAIQYGFRAFVAQDCVADRAIAPHEANLFDLGTKYVDVGPSKVVKDELAARSAEAALR